MHRDVTAAYVSAAARIGAWAVVSAIVYRLAGPAHFATLALIRGTIGILNYTSVGLAPALIRVLAERSGTKSLDVPDHPTAPDTSTERSIFSTAFVVAATSILVGLALASAYSFLFDRLHVVPPSLARQARWAVLLIGLGALLRLFSDACSAVLQMRGRIALDHRLQAMCDSFWALATIALWRWPGVLTASITYAIAGVLLVIARSRAVARLDDSPWPPRLTFYRWATARRLLSFGVMVLLAQVADYFYAPADYILINRFFGPGDVAAYAPGVQIDLGLLMLVTGLAAVLLPRTAMAHVAGSGAVIRRYYVRGTLASAALLSAAALAVWLSYPLIFRIWFGPRPPNTGMILDLVLAGTVIGGSSAVGKSVLIGMGKVHAFTVSALLAGALNVIASYGFVKFGGCGLRGILYGTLVAVIARCVLWMPWYVLRTLNRSQKTDPRISAN